MGDLLVNLPARGEVAPAKAGDGGGSETRPTLQRGPSTMLRMVPLPVPGRIYG